MANTRELKLSTLTIKLGLANIKKKKKEFNQLRCAFQKEFITFISTKINHDQQK